MDKLKKTVLYGITGGTIWGLLIFIIKLILGGVSSFEASLISSIITFCFGGGILGFIIGGFMYIRIQKKGGFIFKNPIVDLSLATVIFWGILYAGGAAHALTDPSRYHIELPGTIRGIIYAAMLGGIIGGIFKIKKVEG